MRYLEVGINYLIIVFLIISKLIIIYLVYVIMIILMINLNKYYLIILFKSIHLSH